MKNECMFSASQQTGSLASLLFSHQRNKGIYTKSTPEAEHEETGVQRVT